MTCCPGCGIEATPGKARLIPQHVPAVDGVEDWSVERMVSVRFVRCTGEGGCGKRWLIPWVELEAIETTLNWLPPEFILWEAPPSVRSGG